MIYSLVKDENESLDEYIQRLVENKDLYELKWYEIADLINKYSEKKLSPDAYRKRVKVHKSEGITKKEDEESHLEELQKLKVKVGMQTVLTPSSLITLISSASNAFFFNSGFGCPNVSDV